MERRYIEFPRQFNITDLKFEDYAGSGINSIVFYTPDCDYYFSYKTLVAIDLHSSDDNVANGLYCLQNYWKQTTGKHLNKIQPNHNKRLSQKNFDNILETFVLKL